MNSQLPTRVAVIGGGWAGMAAAVRLVELGAKVTLYEASRQWGGRARSLPAAADAKWGLDNGQHILIGAYSATLRLMKTLAQPDSALHRMRMDLRDPRGHGLRAFPLPRPLDTLVGILAARGWGLRDKWSLIQTVMHWQRSGFSCETGTTVSTLCRTLTDTVRREWAEPLCVAALNTPIETACGQVFLRVLQDSVAGPPGSSDFMLPTQTLGTLLPEPASNWLEQRGSVLKLAQRVTQLQRVQSTGWWEVITASGDSSSYPALIWATDAHTAGQTFSTLNEPSVQHWCQCAKALQYEAIATVYTHHPSSRLARPILALTNGSDSPAQFVLDRGQLGAEPGLLAWVASAVKGDRASIESAVMKQAHRVLGHRPQPVQTVVEKRATFACMPGLRRPVIQVTSGVWAAGDYIQGPYPATLEGAVRSGEAAAQDCWAALNTEIQTATVHEVKP